MNMHDWNPNFVDLSPMFGPFLHLKKYFANYASWPEHTHLNKLALLLLFALMMLAGIRLERYTQAPGAG